MSKQIDFRMKSDSRYKTLFEIEIDFLGKIRKVDCKFDTGAEVTLIGLRNLVDNDIEYNELRDKIIKNGKEIKSLASYSGVIRNVYELPITSMKVADEYFNNIAVGVALDSAKSVIGMDIAGLFEYSYHTDKHMITYERVRKWERNANVKYTLAREIEESGLINQNDTEMMQK